MAPDWLDFLKDADSKITGWAKAVAAVAGAIAAVLGVVFLLLPWLKPDEPCKGQQLAGQLTKLVVDRSVTYGGYLKLIHASTDGVDPNRLLQRGKLLAFQVEAIGYKGKRLPIRWTTLTADGEPVPEPALNDQLALELKPEDCTDTARESVWTANPAHPGRYLVEVTLFDDDGQALDAARSGTFAI
jgi:hypothetical protein